MAKNTKAVRGKTKQAIAAAVGKAGKAQAPLEKVITPSTVTKKTQAKSNKKQVAAIKPSPIPPTSGKFSATPSSATPPPAAVPPVETTSPPLSPTSTPSAPAPQSPARAPKVIAPRENKSTPSARNVTVKPAEVPTTGKFTGAKAPSSTKSSDTLRIAFVTAECVPFAKTGGLGDAVGGLAKALHRLGHEVRIIMPLYASIDYNRFGLQYKGSACIHMGGNEENWVGVHTGKLDGEVEVWFIEYGRFFHRPGIYHDSGGDYSDNAYRFGLLDKAAMQLCKDFDFIPDVMHLHDWPAAPTAAFLKTWDKFASPLSGTASVLTIHNVGHQGKYHAGVMAYYGLGNEHFTADKFEDFGAVNLLKAGVYFADEITTVSPAHAREILEPIGGQGLEIALQKRREDVSGVLNGVDYEHWHPGTDALLPARFDASDLKGKAVCKAALQKRFGLEPRADVPLFGIVSRFAPQKGIDLLTGALPRALNGMAMQLAVLGTGDPGAEGFFNWLHSIYPARVGVYIGFSNELSHLIEAGSDFFVMPSLYEPCGLNQIYSLAYGTLPLVRATGGLADTVENYNQDTGDGTGFVFNLPTSQALYDTIGWAVSTWYDRPAHYKKLQQIAMKKKFPWENSARQYVAIYQRAIAKRRATA